MTLSVTRIGTAVVAAGTALALSACGGTSSEPASSSTAQVKVTDAQRGEISLPSAPKKVVVLDWSAVRTLNDLGVTPAAVPKAQGDLPQDLKKFASAKTVGTAKEPDYEAISELQPDLIIIGTRTGTPEVLKKVQKITPNVLDVSVRAPKPSETASVIEKRTTDLAKVFGKEAAAQKQLDAMRSAIKDVSAKTARANTTAMFVQASGGKLGYYGPGSRMGMLYEPFGFKPTKAPNENKEAGHGQDISQEFFAKYNPGAIFVLDRSATVGEKSSANALDNQLVKSTDAGKNNKIVTVDGFSWYFATYSPTSVTKMAADAAKAL